MESMTAYDLAQRIATERGWTCTPQSFHGQARLIVQEEQRWLGVTTVPATPETYGHDDVVLLHAGNILADGAPTPPVVETSAQSTDMDALLHALERLWQRLGEGGTKHLEPGRPAPGLRAERLTQVQVAAQPDAGLPGRMRLAQGTAGRDLSARRADLDMPRMRRFRHRLR
jgi:hypothetical protein